MADKGRSSLSSHLAWADFLHPCFSSFHQIQLILEVT